MIVEASVCGDVCWIAYGRREDGRRRSARAARPDRPLAHAAQWERVQDFFREAGADGARLIAGGAGRPEGRDRGHYARPTIFAAVTPDMTIWREKVFGSVLTTTPFDGEVEGLSLANGTNTVSPPISRPATGTVPCAWPGRRHGAGERRGDGGGGQPSPLRQMLKLAAHSCELFFAARDVPISVLLRKRKKRRLEVAEIIDASEGISRVRIDPSWSKGFVIVCGKGFRSRKYLPDDISTMQQIDEETYRSAGGDAGWGIAGGVLTGGVGLLAGAAFGGRRRGQATYLIHFNDGKHVAFRETDKSSLKALQKQYIKFQTRASEPT